VNEENMNEAQFLASLNKAVLRKINEARKKGEITPKCGIKLKTWWQEFMETLKLPNEIRLERMREAIRNGESSFGDTAVFKNILAAFGVKSREVCKSCYGTGWEKCSKCGGTGQLYGSTPRGYIGMPIRSVCDTCYGRGGDPCVVCDGKGYR
jgi:hypothetical protein